LEDSEESRLYIFAGSFLITQPFLGHRDLISRLGSYKCPNSRRKEEEEAVLWYLPMHTKHNSGIP